MNRARLSKLWPTPPATWSPVARSALDAFLLTAIVMTATLLVFTFAAPGDPPAHREWLFGLLVFDSELTSDGATAATTGFSNAAPAVALFLVLTALLTARRVRRQRKTANAG